ncbi:hypothetical protein [Synechococcus sp. 8F6]|uniref:hypothetical protein n=1 Tax=Synechococcus sp. 8F6 TaxID=2025606 RepID=UPI001E35D3CE|nr:hypothetical protein [Synechococcus sp. 8F6]
MGCLSGFAPLPLLLALAGAATPALMLPLQAQDLVGCQLVDGQLSCVPGVSADPQAQISALRQQISADLAQESAVQQQIDGLQQLVLQGEAVQGQVLQAAAVADLLAALPPQAFHWYRRTPGASQWLLISGASGPTYVLQPQDVSSEVMVVVTVSTPEGGANRQASTPLGPVRPTP